MPLYNSVVLSGKSTEKSNDPPKSRPNASMKLLQDHLLSKQRLKQNSQAKAQKSTPCQTVSESALHKPSENDWDPEDEYDPIAPNSYELLQAEYVKSSEERRIKEANKESPQNLFNVLDQLEEDDYDNNKTCGTAIAPPPSLICPSSTDNRLNDDNSKTSIQLKPNNALTSEKGSVAERIMLKMGYKAGHGLGKDEQGIICPLGVEKIGLISARVLPSPQKPPAKDPNKCQTPAIDPNMAELLRESTRVLLLQNMVGPGEVDADLEAETKDECKKYGDVVKCLIYEIPNQQVPDEEAVRIFVEFRKVESAIKAASDLNGRYFGGRIVRVTFYSLDKFNKYELGPGDNKK